MWPVGRVAKKIWPTYSDFSSMLTLKLYSSSSLRRTTTINEGQLASLASLFLFELKYNYTQQGRESIIQLQKKPSPQRNFAMTHHQTETWWWVCIKFIIIPNIKKNLQVIFCTLFDYALNYIHKSKHLLYRLLNRLIKMKL